MRRLTRRFYIWVLAGAFWASLAWLIPLVLFDFRDTVGSVAYFTDFRGTVLVPVGLLWTAAVVVNWSLWALARRVDILVIPLGLLSVGLPAIVIGGFGLVAATCSSNSDFTYLICPRGEVEIRMAILAMGAGMVLLSIPAWVTAGVAALVLRLSSGHP